MKLVNWENTCSDKQQFNILFILLLYLSATPDLSSIPAELYCLIKDVDRKVQNKVEIIYKI